MRVAIWTPLDHALGRLHNSLKKRLEADGHVVDVYNWSFRENTFRLRDRILTYDRVVGTSLLTSSGLFDLSSVHVRNRLIAVAHIGVNNEHFCRGSAGTGTASETRSTRCAAPGVLKTAWVPAESP